MSTDKNIRDRLLENWKDSEYPKQKVKDYCNYIYKLTTEKKYKNWKWEIVNDWSIKKTDSFWIENFEKLADKWIYIDWVHATFQKTWPTFDYVWFKNQMLTVYPWTIMDIQLVYEWDETKFWKESWKVFYEHNVSDPFGRDSKDSQQKIKGWYCIIKNKKWEFLTTLSKSDFEKHRKVAKWDFIWQAWYEEMCMKTLIKKACKYHFEDDFWDIMDMDNEENDVEQWTKKILEEQQAEQEEKLKNKYLPK